MKEAQNPEIAEAMRLLSKYTEQGRAAGHDAGSDSGESDESTPDEEMRLQHERENQQMLSEISILQRELQRVKQLAREQQDELHFAKVRFEEKARQLGETNEELRIMRQQHEQMRRKCDDLQRTCHAQYTQNLELQYAVERGAAADLPRRLRARQPEEATAAFQHQKELTLRCMRTKKQLRETRARMAEKLALQEQSLMWMEDPNNSTVATLFEAIRQRDEAARKEKERWFGAGPGRSSLVHVPTRSMASDRSEASWELPKHKTQLVTTEDKYLECKIAKSGFRDPLRFVREQIYPVARDFKESSDAAVTELWYLYTGATRSIRPKEDFFRKTSGQITKSKVLLAEMLRRVNTIMKAFLKEEKDIKDRWLIDNAPTNHVETQADIPGPPDPLVEEQAAEIKMLRDRMDKMRHQTTTETNKLSLAKEKAELNLQFLQGKLFTLHRELYTNLHLVYKHRYKWISRLPDPLRELKLRGKEQKLALDLQFNLKLGEVMDKDAELLRTFGQYFTSDELFGVDMSAAAERDASERKTSRVPGDMWFRRRPSVGEAGAAAADKTVPQKGRRPSAPDSAPSANRRTSIGAAVQSAAAPNPIAETPLLAPVAAEEPGSPRSDPGGDGQVLSGCADEAGEKAASLPSPSGRRHSLPEPRLAAAAAAAVAASTSQAPANPQPRQRARRQSLPPGGGSKCPDAPGEQNTSRMEQWRLKQSQLWQNRRRESAAIAKDQIPYVAARSSPRDTPLLMPTADSFRRASAEGAEARPRRSSSDYEVERDSGAHHAVTAAQSASVSIPPDSAEVFNRIILKRRNLPLRPTKEPNLQEGAYGSGYLLEGNRVVTPQPPLWGPS